MRGSCRFTFRATASPVAALPSARRPPKRSRTRKSATVLSDRLSRLDADLEARLRVAIDRGELKSDVDAGALAVLASSLLHSISIRARAGKSREELTELARNAVSVICGG